ncbi:MAG: hypothetical protein ACLU38_06280, partial [Dysosmobacter sp.]
QSVFTGTTANSTACRHGSTRKPRSQPTAEQFSPVGQSAVFENVGTAKLRRAGISGPLLVLRP